jgi:hypothetical protein
MKKEESGKVEAPNIAVSVDDAREEVKAIWKEVINASVKEKAVAWKVVLENDLLSKVEIAEDFPLRDETALILLRFREQVRMTGGAEAVLVEPHTASYKSTVSDISLYGPRSCRFSCPNLQFIENDDQLVQHDNKWRQGGHSRITSRLRTAKDKQIGSCGCVWKTNIKIVVNFLVTTNRLCQIFTF